MMHYRKPAAELITTEQAKKILEREGGEYTDEQVKKIVDFLGLLIDGYFDNYYRKKNENSPDL